MSPIRYPVSLMTEARRLYAAGWSAFRIHQMFVERGLDPAPSRPTIHGWVDDHARERYRAAQRRHSAVQKASRATFRLSGSTPEYQAAFIRRLHEEGMTFANIARCCNVVFPGRWTRERVTKIVRQEQAG